MLLNLENFDRGLLTYVYYIVKDIFDKIQWKLETLKSDQITLENYFCCKHYYPKNAIKYENKYRQIYETIMEKAELIYKVHKKQIK